jgi:uncharacterized membrane protein YhaH (DUF805 family)
MLVRALVMGIALLSALMLAGCAADSTVNNTTVSKGQALIDLKKAYDAGAISDRECESSARRSSTKTDGGSAMRQFHALAVLMVLSLLAAAPLLAACGCTTAWFRVSRPLTQPCHCDSPAIFDRLLHASRSLGERGMLYALFSWSGRLGRLAYFGYSVLLITVLVVLGLILLLPLYNAQTGAGVGIAIGVILALMAIFGGFCLAAKRLHDLDMSAWHYAWIILVPGFFNGLGTAMQKTGSELPGLIVSLIGSVISLGVGLFLMFWPGTDGTNRFGERP